MKIVDIWTLEDIHKSRMTQEDIEIYLGRFRAIKYAVRVLWPELAMELDRLCKNE